MRDYDSLEVQLGSRLYKVDLYCRICGVHIMFSNRAIKDRKNFTCMYCLYDGANQIVGPVFRDDLIEGYCVVGLN